MPKTMTATDIESIHKKLDYLTEYVEAQQKRQQEFDELKQDAIPIANHMIKLSIDELAEIGTEFQVEDLFYLLKRLLRNTGMLLRLVDILEAGMDLTEELKPIGLQAFSDMVETLDRLEREGYFTFMREGWGIVERIVQEFNEDDVRALGDNIVAILKTVRRMTQPEILSLADQAISAIQPSAAEEEDVSTLALLRELSDPKVRRGMSRILNLLKALADQPTNQTPNEERVKGEK
ncbi:MAG: DUF1641 domain-containing protein [Anaerolineales bacterium]|nr:DUF1641 domain-containing protein [Anaerolineales bacterium]